MIRAIVFEDSLLPAQHLASLLEDTCQVEVIVIGTGSAACLRLCSELRPDVVFLDIDLPSENGGCLATGLIKLKQPPRLVFTAENANRAADAFRLEAVDYLLKPLDPLRVAEAVERLVTCLSPFRYTFVPGSAARIPILVADQRCFTDTINELLPVAGEDRDQIRLLARREVVAVVRRSRRTWIHTVLEEFATYYTLAEIAQWLGGDPFVQVGRHAVVNSRAIEHTTRYGDRLCRVKLHDRLGSEITTSRRGAARLTALLKSRQQLAEQAKNLVA
jgi:two-component system, LytTR family, response regulator LytT